MTATIKKRDLITELHCRGVEQQSADIQPITAWEDSQLLYEPNARHKHLCFQMTTSILKKGSSQK